MKIAGREAGKMCVIIDIIDNKKVLIDGQTKRRNCSINHVEPLKKVLDLKKGASHAEVFSALKKEGIEVRETKPKTKKPQAKPETAPKAEGKPKKKKLVKRLKKVKKK
jgi:large subunit ribosomal protein L14e